MRRLICIKQYFQLVGLIITVQCKREQYTLTILILAKTSSKQMNDSINEICWLSLTQTQQHGQTQILLRVSEAIVRFHR
ncbi:unnamed protein product [Rotaria magnacalcarata]